MNVGSVLLAIASASLLAACGSEDRIDEKNASPEDVAKKVGTSDIRPQPGRWQGTFKIEAIEMPNLPAEAKSAMAERHGMTQTQMTCLTPEQAAKPDASFFQKAAKGCTYDHFTMSGGTLDAKMTCTEGPQRQVTTMTGSYSPTSYDLTANMQSEMMPGQPMTMRVSIKMARVGECTGDETG